jgi:cell division protein FtsI/penicillin-binding protein 2
MILDRNGEILAANIPVRKVVVDGSHIKNPEALATLAATYLDIPKATLLKELQTRSNIKSFSRTRGRKRRSLCSVPWKQCCAAFISTRIRRAPIRTDPCSAMCLAFRPQGSQ